VSRRGLLLFSSMCVIWGVPYLMIRVAVEDISPGTLVFARTALAALLLLPVAAVRGELRPLLQVWRPLVVFAGIEIALPWLLLGRAEQRLSSSLTGLLIAAVPLVAMVATSLTGERERHGARRWLGLFAGMAGVAAIVGLNLGSVSAQPLLEISGVAVCYAVGPIILSRRLSGQPALAVIAASLTLTAIVYLPVAIFDRPAAVPPANVILSVVGLAVACTAVAFLLFFALIAEIGPARATVITYVNPAVAAVLGVAVLSERFTRGMALGFVLVLAGSALATDVGRRRSAVGDP
jgi:drug/metabolite transporter (DMT)-like permease